jgi:hypothetical protein
VGNTVAVLVEEAEGLLELGDLVVGELVRHGNPSEDLTEGGRQAGREASREWLEVGREKERRRGYCAVSGQRQSQTDRSGLSWSWVPPSTRETCLTRTR